MEYRMKYRDVPWMVALTVLPGKIIGTFFIKPPIYLKRNFKRLFLKYMPPILLIMIVLMVLMVVFMVVDHLSGGNGSAWLKHIFLKAPEINAP